MKRYLSLLFIFLLCFTKTKASHIVGGEFELIHLENYTYRLTLNLYFDVFNGSPGAENQSVIVAYYSKTNNSLIGLDTLPKISRTRVNYSNIDCVDSQLRTDKIVYYKEVTLNPNKFGLDPNGYYVVWERCCRNKTITNIDAPDDTGQSFYMELPPVMRNNNRFINSSPRLFAPVSDYACVGKLFQFNFSGTDNDGDELVYSLTTPFAGSSSPNQPNHEPNPPKSAPYRLVNWLPGFNVNNQVSGTPSLKINSKSGLLFVTPDKTGLYVFAIKVEEFRKNQQTGTSEKIGETRREFQLFVVDCPTNEAPEISAINPSTNLTYNISDTLKITKDNNCLKIKLKDIDPDERLKLRAFSNDLDPQSYTISRTQGSVNSSENPSNTLEVELCINECKSSGPIPYLLQLVAYDDACSVPESDTINLKIKIIPEPNDPPKLDIPASALSNRIKIGNTLSFPVKGKDINNDQITIQALYNGQNVSQLGMNYPTITNIGEINSTFSWKPDCKALRDQEYEIKFIITDTDCNKPYSDTVTVKIQVFDNDLPAELSSDLKEEDIKNRIKVQAGQSVQFNLFGNDVDTTQMELSAAGKGFNMADIGMSFQASNGVRSIRSPFVWKTDCSQLGKKDLKDTLVVQFSLMELACPENRIKTMEVTFELIDTTQYDVKTYNVITPNGDNLNEYFSLDELPLNNCIGEFEFVEVYNRWGNLVFKDTLKEFRWNAHAFPAGTYYYYIKFTNKDFKNWLMIMK